jgi:hypothetical protein
MRAVLKIAYHQYVFIILSTVIRVHIFIGIADVLQV